MGANSKWTYERIAESCDGWTAIDRMTDVADGLERLRISAQKVGRPMSDFDITVSTAPEPARVEQLIELGVTRIVFGVPSELAETVLPMLDERAKLVEQYR